MDQRKGGDCCSHHHLPMGEGDCQICPLCSLVMVQIGFEFKQAQRYNPHWALCYLSQQPIALYCSSMRCSALSCTVPFCSALSSNIPFWSARPCIIPFCSALSCTIPFCSALSCCISFCSHYSTHIMFCTVLHYPILF